MADAGTIERFEPCRDRRAADLHQSSTARNLVEATLAVVAAGWVADTAGLALDPAGVQTSRRGYVEVDAQLRTTAPHVFAAGDITGRAMVVHEATRQALVAATNAVLGANTALPAQVSPIGSFTDPEYASVGLTEAAARQAHKTAVTTVRFGSPPAADHRRPPDGVLQAGHRPRAPHDPGLPRRGRARGRAAQLASTAMAAQMTVGQLALVPFSFPTYANALGRAAIKAARELDLPTASSGRPVPAGSRPPGDVGQQLGASATCFRASASVLVIGRLADRSGANVGARLGLTWSMPWSSGRFTIESIESRRG